MPKNSKLGRNPLTKIRKQAEVPVQTQTDQFIQTIFEKNKIQKLSAAAKIRELNIEINWQEFYDATLGHQLKKVARLFSGF